MAERTSAATSSPTPRPGSANGSTAWTDIAKSPVTNVTGGAFNPGSFDISSVVADPHDATGKTVYATVMGFAGNGINAAHVYRSLDGGAHWANISSNLPNAPANSLLVDPNDANTIYVAMDTGIYATTQVTTCATATVSCWSVYGTSLPNAPVVALQASAGLATGDGRNGELRAATYGRGIWQIPLLTAASPAAPAMTLSPTSLTFAAQAVATASAAQSITVTNSGNAPLTITQIAPSGDFNETGNCIRTGNRCRRNLHRSGRVPAHADRYAHRRADNLRQRRRRTSDSSTYRRRHNRGDNCSRPDHADLHFHQRRRCQCRAGYYDLQHRRQFSHAAIASGDGRLHTLGEHMHLIAGVQRRMHRRHRVPANGLGHVHRHS